MWETCKRTESHCAICTWKSAWLHCLPHSCSTCALVLSVDQACCVWSCSSGNSASTIKYRFNAYSTESDCGCSVVTTLDIRAPKLLRCYKPESLPSKQRIWSILKNAEIWNALQGILKTNNLSHKTEYMKYIPTFIPQQKVRYIFQNGPSGKYETMTLITKNHTSFILNGRHEVYPHKGW